MLDAAAVTSYTGGRLSGDDATLWLNVALAAARRWCGWHVTPIVEDDEQVLDGTGSTMLLLPTLRLVTLTSIIENGRDIDLATVECSPRGMVRKISHLSHHGYYGRHEHRFNGGWTSKLGGITVKMTHGFDADAVPDFESAVLSIADRSSQAPDGGKPIAVGPFRWPEDKPVDGSAFTLAELSILEQYRLERPA